MTVQTKSLCLLCIRAQLLFNIPCNGIRFIPVAVHSIFLGHFLAIWYFVRDNKGMNRHGMQVSQKYEIQPLPLYNAQALC